MLEQLKPSTELTGGPWYTDKELDTEFIKLLSDVCFKILKDKVSNSHVPASAPVVYIYITESSKPSTFATRYF